MEPRLTSAMIAASLVRRAESEGGFGAVLAKGDAIAGALLVILTRRGAEPLLLERLLQVDGRYAWEESARGDAVHGRVERRHKVDPDLWVIELDVGQPERFADEIKLTS